MSEIQEHVNEIASSLASIYLSAPLTDIRLIQGKGEVNQVYAITANSRRAILRINDYSEFERFKKEEWCIESARANSIPTPKLLHVGSDDKCSYTLFEFISGDNGRTINDTNDTWYVLGKHLRLIHSIAVKGFGDTLSDITDGNTAQWQKYVEDNIRALRSTLLVEKGILTSTQTAKLQALFRELMSKNFSLGLNHGDYSLANTIISSDGTPYIIDWGSAQAHIVPHHDLAVILEESLGEEDKKYTALLSGYGMTRWDYEVIKEEILVLQLLDALDKVRWAIDKAPHRVEHHSIRLANFAKKTAL